MIPASATYAVPGADDPAIFADLLRTIAPQADAVAQALERLDALAGGPFADLDADAQAAGAERLRTTRGSGAAVLVALVAQCYYRDDRVMRSLGMEARPPFPAGLRGGARRLVAARAGARPWQTLARRAVITRTDSTDLTRTTRLSGANGPTRRLRRHAYALPASPSAPPHRGDPP
jgi:hypothetical protein